MLKIKFTQPVVIGADRYNDKKTYHIAPISNRQFRVVQLVSGQETCTDTRTAAELSELSTRYYVTPKYIPALTPRGLAGMMLKANNHMRDCHKWEEKIRRAAYGTAHTNWYRWAEKADAAEKATLAKIDALVSEHMTRAFWDAAYDLVSEQPHNLCPELWSYDGCYRDGQEVNQNDD